VLHGLDPLSNPDVERFFEMLPRRLARRGLPVLLTDHVTKDREGRGRYAIGAQHKLAAIDGAAYSLAVVRPFGRGLAGAALLTVTKDRPGYVRQAAGPGGRIGELRVASLEEGRVTVGIEPPTASETGLSVGKRRTLSALQAAGPMVTASQLQERIADEGSIPLKLRTVQTALVALEGLGLATGTEAGPGEVRYWTATGEAP